MTAIKQIPKPIGNWCHVCKGQEKLYVVTDMRQTGAWTVFCKPCIEDLAPAFAAVICGDKPQISKELEDLTIQAWRETLEPEV